MTEQHAIRRDEELWPGQRWPTPPVAGHVQLYPDDGRAGTTRGGRFRLSEDQRATLTVVSPPSPNWKAAKVVGVKDFRREG